MDKKLEIVRKKPPMIVGGAMELTNVVIPESGPKQEEEKSKRDSKSSNLLNQGTVLEDYRANILLGPEPIPILCIEENAIKSNLE